MGVHSLKKDTDIYMEKLWISVPSESIYYLLRELYNSIFGYGKVGNATVVLGLVDVLSSQKNHLCNSLLVLESTFPGTMEQTKYKINPTMTMGMQRLSQILNRNSEKLLSVSLLSELGAVKAFSWAMKSPWNSTANLQTHSGQQRKEEISLLCKGRQQILHFNHDFTIKDHKTLNGLETEESGHHFSYLLSEAVKSHQGCTTVYVGKGRLSFCEESICCGGALVWQDWFSATPECLMHNIANFVKISQGTI